MKELSDLKIEITEVKGDLKLVNQELDSIKTNHLSHIQKSITTINKILWTVGIMIFAELVLLLRQLLLG